jgi:hypothetical protein
VGFFTSQNPTLKNKYYKTMTQNNEKQIIDREQEIIFTNYSDEDFDGRWNESINHKVWKLKSGKSYYLPFYLAEHFARHLVDRELEKKNLPTNHFSRQALMDKCVTIPANPDITMVQMKEVPVREVRLATEERRENYIEKGNVAPSDIPARVHTSSVKQRKEEEKFEGMENSK